MKPFFCLIRPKHWIKNLIILAPLLFSFSFDQKSIELALFSIASFSLFASAIYVINDIYDVKSDRSHPEKKNRPIASGKISVFMGFCLFYMLLLSAFFLGIRVGDSYLITAIVYLALNLIYSMYLKHEPIVDVIIIAFGFVIRVIAGALAISVGVSHWLLLCTFFIALFMAFGKRKNEMYLLGQSGRENHRKSISEYTDGFIDQMLAITAGISVVFYSLYTIDKDTVSRFGNDNLIYTTPLVVFGIFRYFHLLYNKNDGGDPVALFTKDKQLIFALLSWVAFVVLIYYKFPLIEKR